LSDLELDQLIADEVELGPRRDEVLKHLADCNRCTTRFASFESVRVGPVPAFVGGEPARLAKHSRSSVWWGLSGTLTIALAFGLARLTGERDQGALLDQAPSTRTKGALALGIVVQRAGGDIERLTPGGLVAPGESMRFELATAGAGFVAVFGLDSSGQTTAYAPYSGAMIAVTSDMPSLLPNSIVADATLGPERIVAFFCEQEQPVTELAEAARSALERAKGNPIDVHRIDTPCAQADFLIEKQGAP
jgi:hypothetical protein